MLVRTLVSACGPVDSWYCTGTMVAV